MREGRLNRSSHFEGCRRGFIPWPRSIPQQGDASISRHPHNAPLFTTVPHPLALRPSFVLQSVAKSITEKPSTSSAQEEGLWTSTLGRVKVAQLA